MPETQTTDEVVSTRLNGGPARARVENEVFDPSSGKSVIAKSGAEEDAQREGGHAPRVFNEKVQKLFDALEKPAPAAHEEGDPDEETPAAHEEGDPDEEPPAEEAAPDGEEAPAEGETTDTTPSEVETLRGEIARRDEANQRLLAELETAKQTPARERTPREQALVEAETAYVDEGSVPALRKFLGTIIGAAPDSKEVDAELRGLYADLTARELNVPLSESQQAVRDAARARLALARDKRERAESEKKVAPVNADESQQLEKGAQYIDSQLSTKGQSGTSIADEFPLLMTLAEDFDGMKPALLLATAIKQEYTTGALDQRLEPAEAIRTVARKIEAHYDTVAKKISKATQPKTDTTKGDPKAPATAKTSNETRQSHGARTLNNATASKAPATSPKMTQKAAPKTEKTRKDFKTDAEWKAHLLRKHFPTT